ncbi:MAG: hypothetical protein OXB86_01535, partial [Bdellovibrionales bacterium]|nr:hypothetical protein [Bdellovibrionales bacterium]
PNKNGPKCYCKGQLCSAVYKQCQKYLNFKSLGSNNICQCVNLDEDGKRFLGSCKSVRNTLPALNKCKKRYSDLDRNTAVRIIGGWRKAGGGPLNCDCEYKGKTSSCENVRSQIKKPGAMQTCRAKYKSAVTRAVSMKKGPHSGVKCYCGNQLCSSVSNQCRTKYGKKFTHIDSENDCMCGSERCEDRLMGNKLQKCIEQNKDIYRGVTVKRNGTCMCGKQTCDSLRRRKIASCKEYEGLGYTGFKNGHCMCGPAKCIDRKKPQKKVDSRCFSMFRGLSVVESLDTPGGLVCRCLHKGKRKDCKTIKKKSEKQIKQEGAALEPIFMPPSVAGEPVEVAPAKIIPAGAGPDDTIVPPAPETPPDKKQICKKWQKKKYFRRKGRVKDNTFCSAFASNKKDCKKAFDGIRKEIGTISKLEARRKKLEESLTQWEDKQFEAQFSEDEDESETEAGSLFCTKCLADLRSAAGPGPWQRFGSGLSIALGAGLSAFGVGEARRSQDATNQLLALQGMPAENNFGYSMAGLSLGYPLMSKGLADLSRGSFACGRTPSPYPRPYPASPMFY